MNEEHLLEMIKLLEGEVRHLRRHVHLQGAQIQALRAYCVARIADLNHQDRKTAFQEISTIFLEAYDRHISKIEAEIPGLAADIDMRGTMNQEDQEIWYLLEKYYPKPNGPLPDV